MMIRSVLPVIVLACTLGIVAMAEETGFPADASLALTLPDGLLIPGKPDEPKDLYVDLTLRDGEPELTVWATAPDYNLAQHDGRVSAHERVDDGIRVRIDVDVHPDPYLPGFAARYELVLRAAGDVVSGSFNGRMPIDHADHDPRPVSGDLHGHIRAYWPRRIAGHEPPPDGAHPRLFFTADALPGLRERAASGPGAAMVARLKQMLASGEADYQSNGYRAAGWALLWQLEGEDAHLERATELCRSCIDYNAPQERYHGYAQMIAGMAVAYDLCHPGWNEGTRKSVGVALRRWSRMLAGLRWAMYHGAGHGNHPLIKNLRADSVEMLHWRAACGLAALAIDGDPYELPHMMQPDPVETLEPALSEVPPGAAVEPFLRARGGIPQAWTFSGPLEKATAAAKLADQGGVVVGVAGEDGWTALQVHGGTRKDGSHATAETMDLIKPFAGKLNTTGLFSTVLHLKRPRTVAFDFALSGGELYVSGHKVSGTTKLRLKPGYHPLVIGFFARRTPFGSIAQPHFIEEVEDPWAVYEQWQARRERWLAQGRTYLGLDYDIAVHTRQIGKVFAEAAGELGASNGHGQWGLALEKTLPFVAALRHVRGVDCGAGGVLERVVGYVLTSGFIDTHYHERSLANDHNIITAGMDLIDPAQRGAMRTLLDAHGYGIGRPLHAVLALHNYPYDVPASDPQAALPLSLYDAEAGAIALRSGWGEDAILANALGACIGVSGHGAHNAPQRAGEIAIRGFGTGLGMAQAEAWIKPAYAQVHNLYYIHASNCLRIAGSAPTRGASVVQAQTGDDGSGSVTFRLDNWAPAERDSSYRNYSWTGMDKNAADLGITALRAFGADYSGAAGVPGLFVLIDRVSGAGERAVSVPLTIGLRSEFEVEPKRAVIPGPDGRSMQLVQLGRATFAREEGGKSRVLLVRDAAESCIVITLQHGAAPAVTGSFTDGELTATVGGRNIRFDGAAISFE